MLLSWRKRGTDQILQNLENEPVFPCKVKYPDGLDKLNEKLLRICSVSYYMIRER